MSGTSSSDDGGSVIRDDMLDTIMEMYTKEYPAWMGSHPSPPSLPPRLRVRIASRLRSIRWRIADRIGGGHYYSEGCDCDY